MKILLIIVLSTLMCGCGISETKYNKVISQRDSLQLEVNKLKQDVDVLKNGEERLMNFIRLHKDNCEYVKAFDNLNNLKKYHPESPLFKEYEALFSDIEKKATIIIDSIAKAERDSIKLASINELGVWKIGNYVNDFDEPTGEHFVYSEFYGTFSNSATAGSTLRIYVTVTTDYGVSFRFDEYDNGTFEEIEYCNSAKVVNKKLRSVYTFESSYNYRWFRDENRNSISIDSILMKEGIYEFYYRLKYGTKYSFKIDSQYLNNALVKAGIKSIDDL